MSLCNNLQSLESSKRSSSAQNPPRQKLVKKTDKKPVRKSNLQDFIEELSSSKNSHDKKQEVSRIIAEKFPTANSSQKLSDGEDFDRNGSDEYSPGFCLEIRKKFLFIFSKIPCFNC